MFCYERPSKTDSPLKYQMFCNIRVNLPSMLCQGIKSFFCITDQDERLVYRSHVSFLLKMKMKLIKIQINLLRKTKITTMKMKLRQSYFFLFLFPFIISCFFVVVFCCFFGGGDLLGQNCIFVLLFLYSFLSEVWRTSLVLPYIEDCGESQSV